MNKKFLQESADMAREIINHNVRYLSCLEIDWLSSHASRSLNCYRVQQYSDFLNSLQLKHVSQSIIFNYLFHLLFYQLFKSNNDVIGKLYGQLLSKYQNVDGGLITITPRKNLRRAGLKLTPTQEEETSLKANKKQQMPQYGY